MTEVYRKRYEDSPRAPVLPRSE